MAAPSELSLKEIRDFMLQNGGKVTNHDLVKHFKQFLTNPNTKGRSPNASMAVIERIRNDNNWFVLVLCFAR